MDPGLENQGRNSHQAQIGKKRRATPLQQHLREKEPSTTTEMQQHLPFPKHTQQMSPSKIRVQLLWPQIFNVGSYTSLGSFLPLKPK